MSNAALLYAFSAGMVAAINPCGFALLPAYVSYYLGLESAADGDDAGRGQPVLRALAVGGAMTLGFVLVFGIIGAAWTSVSAAIGDRLPWVVVGVGVLLVGLGVAMLFGYVPVARIPKLSTSSGSASALSAFVFGISYGVASLSCAIGPFIAAVTTTFRNHSFLDGLLTLVMYGLGMGAIICILTLAVSFAKHGVVNRLRSLIPHMTRVSGVLLVLSGLVAIYYGWYEARILTGGNPQSTLGHRITGWRDNLAQFFQDTGEERIGIIVAVVVAAAVIISLIVRNAARHEPESSGSVGGSVGSAGGSVAETDEASRLA